LLPFRMMFRLDRLPLSDLDRQAVPLPSTQLLWVL